MKRPITTLERFWRKVDKSGEHWLWTARIDDWGYGRIEINRVNECAHRIAWLLTNGEIPKGMCVCHKCDITSCVRPEHLFLGTDQDNTDDKWRKGRAHTKLTDKEVKEIIVKLRIGYTQSTIAEIYGVAQQTVSEINTGRAWNGVIT